MRATVLLGLLLTTPILAQDEPATPPTPDNIIHVSTQLLTLDALVEDKKTHNLIGGLDRSDFQLTEDGAPQNLTYFDHDQLPLSIVFLFDITDSVRPALKPLAKGALEVLAHLKPQDEVSVMAFSSHTELLQDFTTDRLQAAIAIDKASTMKTSEGAFVHECMYEAIDQAMRSQVPNSRRVLVWLTDGTSNLENKFTQKEMGRESPPILHTEKEDIERLQRTGIVVSGLIEHSTLGDVVVTAALLEGTRFGDIKNFATLTGGPVLKTSKKEVADRLSDLIDDLRSRYTLGYRPSTFRPSGTFCKLTLQLSPTYQQTHPTPPPSDITISTRGGYFR